MITILSSTIFFILGLFIGISIGYGESREFQRYDYRICKSQDWLCGDYCIGAACPHFGVCAYRIIKKRSISE